MAITNPLSFSSTKAPLACFCLLAVSVPADPCTFSADSCSLSLLQTKVELHSVKRNVSSTAASRFEIQTVRAGHRKRHQRKNLTSFKHHRHPSKLAMLLVAARDVIAGRGESIFDYGLIVIVAYIICKIIIVSLVVLLCLSVKRMLGRLVIMYLKRVDLGLDLHIESMKVNPCTGIINIVGVTVANPRGFSDDHLLKAEEVFVQVDIKAFIFGGFKDLVVTEFILRDVHLNYETKLGTWTISHIGDSNFAAASSAVCEAFSASDDESCEEMHMTATQSLVAAEEAFCIMKDKSCEEMFWEILHSQTILKTVKIENVSVEAKTTGGVSLGTLQCNDVHCENFHETEQVAGKPGLYAVMSWLFKSVLATGESKISEMAEKFMPEEVVLPEIGAVPTKALAECCSGLCSGKSPPPSKSSTERS